MHQQNNLTCMMCLQPCNCFYLAASDHHTSGMRVAALHINHYILVLPTLQTVPSDFLFIATVKNSSCSNTISIHYISKVMHIYSTENAYYTSIIVASTLEKIKVHTNHDSNFSSKFIHFHTLLIYSHYSYYLR